MKKFLTFSLCRLILKLSQSYHQFSLKVHYSYPSINGLLASILDAISSVDNDLGCRRPTTTPTVTPTTREMTTIVATLPNTISCFFVNAIVLFSTIDCVVFIATTIDLTCPLSVFLYTVIVKYERENVSTIEKKKKR